MKALNTAYNSGVAMTETTEAEHISILESIRAKVAYDHADYQTVQWALDKIKENTERTLAVDSLNTLMELRDGLKSVAEVLPLQDRLTLELYYQRVAALDAAINIHSEDVPPPVKG